MAYVEPKSARKHQEEPIRIVIKVRFSRAILSLFVLYCIFEVLRITYIGGLEDLPLSIALSVLGVITIVGLRKRLAMDKVTTHNWGHLFSSRLTNVVMTFHVTSIGLVLLTTIALFVDFPSFLIVQLLLLASLWWDNRRLEVSLNMFRTSLIFTIIYVSYVLLLIKNTFIGLVALVYFVSWLYLETKIEHPKIMASDNFIERLS